MANKTSQSFDELAVNELRQLHTAISESLEALRTKALALLVGEVAAVTFIFSFEAAGSANPFASKIIALLIFMAISVLCIGLSAIAFLWVISPIMWSRPPDTRDLKNGAEDRFDNDPDKFLSYLKDEYLASIPTCSAKLGIRARIFTVGVYLMFIGILMMLVIKYGGGTIDL